MPGPRVITGWPEPRELRKWAKTMVLGFGALALVLGLLILRSPQVALFLAGIGLGCAALALVVPPVAAPIYIVWDTITRGIGWVNSRLILAILFVLAVIPMGLLLRLLGKDPLELTIDRGQPSYWHDRDRTIDPERYERQF